MRITFWISCAEKMPRSYSEDLRWRAIFLVKIVSIDFEEVSFYLQISKMTIYQYVNKFRTAGNISTGIIGRPVGCISFHPHEEFVIMELILNHPEKTIAELVQDRGIFRDRICISLLIYFLLFEAKQHNTKKG